MNFLTFNKILYHPENIMAIKNSTPIFPVHATISLGNFCNHRCLWCTAYEYQLDNAHLLDFDKIISFLQKAKKRGLKAITYVGNGEPTAYPRFKELVVAISNLGIEQAMFTNGYLIDRFEDEILNHFTWIRISLDAGSPKVHNYMHDVNNHFDKIIQNTKSLIDKRQNKIPTVGIQYATHHKNLDDLYNSAKISSEIKADYFSVKPVFNRGGVGENIEKNSLTYEDITPVVEHIRKDLENDNFQIFYRPHQILSHEQEHTIFYYKLCVAGFFNVNIYEDNKIIYCGPHRVSVGKITDDLDKIEKNIVKLSDKLDLSKCPAGCRYHELNDLVDNILNQDVVSKKQHLNFI
ncbi:MAG: radical SAM protein [Arcobacteraceae bacterium]|nr:radical SAM protein [Arcobacteraceae bacterium]